MYELTKHDLEELKLVERRDARLSDGTIVGIAATRHHWLVAEECATYGWTLEEILELAVSESKASGHNLSQCFCYLLAYIQADARHVLAVEAEAGELPQLPTDYQPRVID